MPWPVRVGCGWGILFPNGCATLGHSLFDLVPRPGPHFKDNFAGRRAPFPDDPLSKNAYFDEPESTHNGNLLASERLGVHIVGNAQREQVVRIVNQTSLTLERINENLKSGSWWEDAPPSGFAPRTNAPPSKIPAGTSASFGAQSNDVDSDAVWIYPVFDRGLSSV